MAHPVRFLNNMLLLLLLQSCAKPEKPAMPLFNGATIQVAWEDGIVVQNHQPFTGIIYTLQKNGKDTAGIVCFNKGREHGEWQSFYEGGRLREKRFFADGKKTGDYIAWWPNGRRRLVYHFEEGEYEGTCREWTEAGVLIKEMNYKAGYEAGSQQQFYDDGKLKANYVIIEGRRWGLLGTKNCVNVTDSIFKK